MENSLPVKRHIDFAGCNYIRDMYAVIKRQLELPEETVNNTDDLWEALTGKMQLPAE